MVIIEARELKIAKMIGVMPNNKKDNFITLKEAAEISGYSPDYLGQLIRKGKLEGQQVFMNVAWMTTKEAVEEYLSQSKRPKEVEQKSFKERTKDYIQEHWSEMIKVAIYTIIGLNILFIIFLFHLLSFSIEKHFETINAEQVYGSLTI